MTAPATATRASMLPAPDRHEAARLATAQHNAMLALLRELDDRDWERPTDCARWTVRDVVAHLVGALVESARIRTGVRHLVISRRRYPDLSPLDALNEAQVDDRRGWPANQLIADFVRFAPKAVAARRRTPGVIRRRTLPVSLAPAGTTVGQLPDVIYTRDLWMHRIDIARATSRPLPGDETDGEIVAQVIRDLDVAWRAPAVRLELPGAGVWLLGTGEPIAAVRTDAVEYGRLLSGRAAAPVYDIEGDESARAALNDVRVLF